MVYILRRGSYGGGSLSKNLKTILIVSGAILVLFSLPILIVGSLISNTVQDVRDSFTSAYTDEDIIKYVEETHGFDVEVIENEGRRTDSASFGGLIMRDAVVKSLGSDSTQFTVHISAFGKITGDNYEEVKIRQKLNQALRDSDSYKQLENLGFSHIHFGKDKSVPTFTVNFIEERKFGDEETLQILYEAIPILKEWQDRAAEENVHFDTVNFHELQMDLQQSYDSWKDLANILASENVESFTYQFIDQDKEKFAEIEAELSDLNLSGTSLKCYEMKVYDECAAYSLKLFPNRDDNVLRYDDQGDKENLFNTIQLIDNLALPIEKIIVRLYIPNDLEDQIYTEDELKDRGGHVQFATREVEIMNLSGITSVDDIYFEY